MQNDMRDRLIELKINFVENFSCGDCQPENDKCRKCLSEKETDYLIANGVIVPPCNVGDKVYYVRFDEIIETVVSCISFTQSNIHFEVWENPHFKSFELYNIGVVVFLTREEAEQKLKEMRNENG